MEVVVLTRVVSAMLTTIALLVPGYSTAQAASVRKEILINAPPEDVWAALHDFGAVDRLVPGFVVKCVPDGDARIVTFADGRVARELLVEMDDNLRRVVYAEPGGRFVTRSASLQVFAEGEKSSRVVWINDFLPNNYVGLISSNMDWAVRVMKQTLEHAAAGNQSEN
jgi:carbon monoxide dehydrogenase subunit G